jgi:glycosyltransferase involved in cell wall biosynthesis
MSERRYRVLLVASHPTQYSAPLYRLMASHPRLDFQVAFCSLQGAKAGYDAGFGREIAWDIPLLDGYRWVEPRNFSPRPGLERFFGLVNFGLWRLLRRGGFDAVVLHTGYRYATFWIGYLAAKASGTAILFGTDAHQLAPRDDRRWKTWVKRQLWPRLFRLADVVIVSSSGGIGLMRSLGIPEKRLALTPYVVDNGRWEEAAAKVNRAAVRTRWGIPAEAPLVLFSAKLQRWKRPLDLLEAFVRAEVAGSYLVFAGEGTLRGRIEEEIERLGVKDRVKLLGFVNQSALPEIYRACDVLVLPSDYEPFGVVVNEAMLCGCVPIVSDRVGARYDLIEEGRTGLVFPAGDLPALASRLRSVLGDPEYLRQMSEAARRRIAEWSPELSVNHLVQAIEMAWCQAAGHGGGRADRKGEQAAGPGPR